MNQSFNMTNQVTPFGSLSYDQTGSQTITGPDGTTYQVPQYTATTTLDPAQQSLFDTGMSAKQNIADVSKDQSARLGEIFSTGAIQSPDLTKTYNTDFSEDRGRVEEALMSRLNPSLERDRESLRTSLANQGIREGSEAFDRAMNRTDEQATDARMQAILAGGTEQSRLVGLERDRASFENAAAGQQFGMDGNARSQSINEIIGLLSGSQVQTPQFTSTPTTSIPGVDIAGLEMDAYQGELANWQQKQAGLGSILGAGATLLGAPSGSIMGGFFQ